MEIQSLDECPQHLDLVASWVWEHWKDSSGSSLAQTRAQLRGEPDCPATLLALERAGPIGVLGFSRFDHPRLGPRLLFVNSLYVEEAARSRGADGALLAAALIAAAATDRTLYVYTNIPGWYEARGFTCVERAADSLGAVLLRELNEP